MFCLLFINKHPVPIKDTLKVFDDFKNKQKSVWSSVFCYVKVCIFWKCIQYTIYWDKTQMLKKITLVKVNGAKSALFFCELQLITVLLLTCDSYMSWSTRFVSLKLCGKFPSFHSVSFLLKFIVCSTKCMVSLTLNVLIPSKIKII